jgi:GPH family glycoside/pentoside/hexuronide:cation symporter
MTYAAATAGQNFGAGLGAALVGWALAVGAYNAANEVQAPSALSAEIFVMLWLPLILTLAQVVIIYFLNIDKSMSKMQRDLAIRRLRAASDGQD